MVKYTVKGKRRGQKKGRKVYVAKKASPATYTGVKKLVNQMIMKKSESKHKNSDFGKNELNHNSMSVLKINDTSTMPTQGTGDGQRIGDQINMGAFFIRMLCGQKKDRPNVTWKFYVIKVPKGTPVSYSTFFDATTNNVLLDSPNKDKVQVLKALTYKRYLGTTSILDPGGPHVTREVTFPIKLWVPYKRLLRFQADGGVEHTDGDIYLLTFVYDAYGTLVTDNIGYNQVTSTLYYKDP